MARLLDAQITAGAFAEPASEPFKELFRLARKREKVIKKAEDIAVSQAVAWLSLPHSSVPSCDYLKGLKRYDPLLRLIESQKEGHDRYVEALSVIRLLGDISAVLKTNFI